MMTSLIAPPYWTCPKCSDEAFGVLSIYGDRYTRACKHCEYSSSFRLPEIKKKIIYLDQYALSNMLFALNPQINKKSKVDGIWLELFKKLDELCKLNLIVCPDSNYQMNESLVTPWFKNLKRLYELLSAGATFKTDSEIKAEQIYTYAKAWIEGEANPELNIEEVVRGNLFGWIPKLQITVDWTEPDNSITQLRNSRQETGEILNHIFDNWKTEKNVSIEERYRKEMDSFGIGVLEEYNKHIENKFKFLACDEKCDIKTIISPPATVKMVQAVINAFQNCSVSDEDIPIRIYEFFRCEAISKVPFLNASCWLLAALSRNAQNGQKSINRGTTNDINAIASLSTYCNVMLVDNPCRELLRQVENRLNVTDCVFFSTNNLPEFIDYLDKIKIDASAEHLATVKEVYGENWGKPYETLFTHD